MHITLVPVRSDDRLVLDRAGERLTVNGTVLDLAPLPEGAVLPRDAAGCPWLAADITRRDGVLHLALILPHGAGAPEAARFPAPVIDPPDGPVALPQTHPEEAAQ